MGVKKPGQRLNNFTSQSHIILFFFSTEKDFTFLNFNSVRLLRFCFMHQSQRSKRDPAISVGSQPCRQEGVFYARDSQHVDCSSWVTITLIKGFAVVDGVLAPPCPLGRTALWSISPHLLEDFPNSMILVTAPSKILANVRLCDWSEWASDWVSLYHCGGVFLKPLQSTPPQLKWATALIMNTGVFLETPDWVWMRPHLRRHVVPSPWPINSWLWTPWWGKITTITSFSFIFKKNKSKQDSKSVTLRMADKE